MMARRWLTSVFMLALLAVPAWAQQSSREGPPRNIILFGWDGAQRAHVKECLGRGELPRKSVV